MNPPCRGCNRRQIGCHGKCDDYKAFDAERQKIRDARKADHDAMDVFLRGVERNTKNATKKRK